MTRADSKLEQVFDALMDEDDVARPCEDERQLGTVYFIVKTCHMGRSTAHNNLLALRAAGRAHISGWTMAEPPAPLWSKGGRPDVPKPVISKEERAARKKQYNAAYNLHRNQIRATTENTNIAGLGRAKTHATIERAKAAPRPWWAQLTDAQGE